MKVSKVCLNVESLSDRHLMSGSGWFIPLPPANAIQHFFAHLHGTVHGNYHANAIPADTGTSFQFSANTTLYKLGAVTVNASITSVGNVLRGHANGEMTISNNHGQVKLELTGPTQKGGSPLPGSFHYKVIDATGDYTSLKDSGTIVLMTAPRHDVRPELTHGSFWMLIG